MDPYTAAISQIIKGQQTIIGPVALDQAKKVDGLQVGGVDDIHIIGNKKEVLDHLVHQYSKLFGQASIEVCKEAFGPFVDKIPSTDVPDILKN